MGPGISIVKSIIRTEQDIGSGDMLHPIEEYVSKEPCVLRARKTEEPLTGTNMPVQLKKMQTEFIGTKVY